MIELLSPAGSRASLEAAVQAGADAVYMGFGAFNARRNAKNFTDEEFADAVTYCHLRGVRVFLTLNTLLTDRELPQAAEALRKASDMGVDAVLIQDWGALTLAQAVAPDLPIHASTQMSLFTAGGARWAEGLGMERVVLARELSREDIARVCQSCGAEIEVFVHGALCMCYSGQCTMSALIGQRSGNRGACAQPCRLPYGVNGPCRGQYPLSLKDANLSAYLQELEQMGVACLKLEGRMKRPEYVAVVTAVYRRLLDEGRGPTEEESRALYDAFSRSGFTDGYYRHRKGPAMFGTRPESAPEPKELFAQARQLYENGEHKRIPITLQADLRAGQPFTLIAGDGTHTVTVTGAVPETARTRELTAQDVVERLKKTGGTVFRCESVHVTAGHGLMLSAAAINGARRDVLEALAQARTALPRRRTLPTPELPACETAAVPAPKLTCSIARAEQLTAALAEQAAVVYVPIELLPEIGRYHGKAALCAVLPRVWRDGDEAGFRKILETTPSLSAVTVGNAGHMAVVEGLPLAKRGDFGLNVFNSRAVAFWQGQGLDSVTLSFELRHQQVREIRKYLPCEAIVYGRLPLMITENCMIGNAGGCRGDKRLCQGDNYLTDRTGARFPLLGQYGCRCEVENSRVLFLADKPEWRQAGLAYARLRFTTETPEQCDAVLRQYLGESGDVPEDFTRGLFYRGVE